MANEILFRSGDVPDETEFDDALDHSAITNYVREATGSHTLNAGTPSLDTETFEASINGTTVRADAVSGVSLTDSATNYVFLRYDTTNASGFEAGTDPTFYVDTANTPEGGTVESLLVYIVDTSADTVVTPNRHPDLVTERLSYSGQGWAVVHKSGGRWYADGADGTIDTDLDAGTVLQAAENNATLIRLADGLFESNGDRITSTITVDSALIDAGMNTIEGDADPIFDFRANARGLHNAKVEGQASGGSKPSNDLVHFNESGDKRMPVLANVSLGFTNGWGARIQGIQQTAIRDVQVTRCGDAATSGTPGGGGLLFTDNEAGTLGANHFQVFGLQFHGSAMGGPIIKSVTTNGNSIALNGMKLVGLDCENGNQSGVGGGSAHIDLQDAQRLKWSNVYMRGLDAVDYAINYNFSNGTNVLENAEIRWDGGVSSGAAIRKHRGATLRLINCALHPSGNGGADVIVGDLTNSTLEVSGSDSGKDVTITGGNLSGEARFAGGSFGNIDIQKAATTIHGTTVTSTSGGSSESQTHIVGGGGTLPALSTRGTTDANGQVALDWETSGGLLFRSRPKISVALESNNVADVTFDTATYNTTTYYTGVTVQVNTDLAGTAAGSGLAVNVDVEARP